MRTNLSRLLAAFLFVAFPFLAMAVGGDEQQLEIDNFEIIPGEQEEIQVKATKMIEDYTGFQASVTLPTGLQYVSAKAPSGHSLSANLSGSTLRLAGFSTSGTAYTDNDVVAIITVKAASTFKGGTIKISNTVFALADGTDESNGNDTQCTVTAGAPRPASITIDKGTSASMLDTETLQLKATVLPTGVVEPVTWTSSNPDVATISNSGLVTAVKVGTTTITATCGSVSATCEITVNETPVTALTLSQSTLSLQATQTATLTATITPSNATNKTITWSTSAEGIATVDADGKVTAVAVGEATITAKAASGVEATCKISVVETPAASISLNKTEATLKATETVELTATILPETTTNKSVTWSTSAEGIATVDADGKVTAVAVGEATITAKAASGVEATCKITVVETPAASISLNKTEATLKATETVELTATILPATTTNKSVTWSTSAEGVATVDANGKVTAVAVGEATITATAASGVKATCKITVVETPAASISLNKTEATLKATETLELVATILPETTTNKSVTWSTSAEGIATVDANGKVTAVAVGEATITAKAASGVEATCKITVVETPAASISLNKTEATLKATETVELTATILPETTTNKSVTWSTSAEGIATVDADGKVTAVAVGEATITAKAASGVEATCKITVVETPAASISLNKTEATLKATETFELVATILPKTTTNKSVTWSTSAEGVATVDANGKVTAVAVGEATITAKAASGVEATCKITVVETPAASISLNKTEATLKATETLELVATILPETTTDKSVTWSTSAEGVATVDANGKVTAVAVGEATITARAASGVEATCKITVVETPAASISLNKTEATLKATETVELTATILPATTTNKSVTWSTSAEGVATVDANGKVTAVAVGEATITATAASGVKATCKITVVETPAASISLNKTEATLKATETVELTATILPETTTNKSVTWSTSAEGIATVDADGKVTAVAVGEATITAKAASCVEATCKITVVETPAASISLNKTEATLKATETVELTATILPATTTNKSVTWSTSAEGVATVDANGKVTAVAVGEATITATAASGVKATCKITVVETPAGEIVIDKEALGISGDNLEMKVGETKSVKVTILPETTTDKSVTYESSKPDIATIDENGEITALGLGTTTITVTAKSGISTTFTVTVVATPAESLSIEQAPEVEMKEGETTTLTATILPEDTTSKNIEWSSSAPEIATVDENGVVTAIAEGTTTITAKTTDGSDLEATCRVVVKAVSGIEDLVIDRNTEVKIYNTVGVMIYHGAYSEANLAKGIYIVVTDSRQYKIVI